MRRFRRKGWYRSRFGRKLRAPSRRIRRRRVLNKIPRGGFML